MTGKRLRKITDLEITEISLVDSGANAGARVLLFKRDVSKTAHASDLLGLKLLAVLANRVNNLKQEKDITRLQAWLEVLESPEGKQLLGFIGKAKTNPTSMFKGVEQQDVEELADFLEGPHGGSFLKALSKQFKKGGIVSKEMTVVEKILKKDFQSQIEASSKLKLELTKLASASDKRSPERRYVDYIEAHPDVRDAMVELPDVVVTEVVEKRDFGKAYSTIQKKIDELISNGDGSSRAKLFMRVVDNNPALLVEYYKEQI